MSLEPSDLQRLHLDGRDIVLIGTAHISRESVETVRRVIEEEAPETVCVELDPQRLQALRDENRWRSLNLMQVIRKGQGPMLLANLVLASFQKRMGLQTGVKPGAELAAAAQVAEERGITLELVDRDLRTTLVRAWRLTGWWKRLNMLAALIASLFENHKVDETELARLRQSDTLTALLDEMGDQLPMVKRILVDERDLYMAHFIRLAPGRKIVAVVGAAHVPGIVRHLQGEASRPEEIEKISVVPARTALSRALPWIIPAGIVALFIAGFFFGNPENLADAAVAWILANGLLAALGAVIAFGHPLTVAAAFVAAPITSLNPTVGAGMVTGLVQACLVAPTVHDLESVSDDITTLRGWWGNRMTRVLLVFFFSSIGSAIGTVVAFGWLKDLI